MWVCATLAWPVCLRKRADVSGFTCSMRAFTNKVILPVKILVPAVPKCCWTRETLGLPGLTPGDCRKWATADQKPEGDYWCLMLAFAAVDKVVVWHMLASGTKSVAVPAREMLLRGLRWCSRWPQHAALWSILLSVCVCPLCTLV